MAIDPSLVADSDEREPRKPPIGVRATPTTKTSVKQKAQRIGNNEKPEFKEPCAPEIESKMQNKPGFTETSGVNFLKKKEQ